MLETSANRLGERKLDAAFHRDFSVGAEHARSHEERVARRSCYGLPVSECVQ